MEMDIPLPDELEWLEANSCSHEDHLHPPSPDPYPPDDGEPPPPPPPPLPSNVHKRHRPSVGPDSPFRLEEEHPAILRSDEKRTKLDSPECPDPEDWLRYSPPREQDGVESSGEPEPAPAAEEERIISRYASEIDGDFVPVTAPSGGDRVYAKISRFMGEEMVPIKSTLVSRVNGEGLLVEPIGVLLNRLEQEALTKALRASSEVEVQSDSGVHEAHDAPSRLWVDKYAPSSFTELLSDEQTNREVLLWLKQWDSTVFGSEIKSTSDEVFSALRRHSSVAKQHKPSESTIMMKNRGQRWKSGSVWQSNEIDNQSSNFKGGQELQKKPKLAGPPEHKILLLCGPPGLGKTTLAHVAAKHCGYRVVEVNASDDRSTSVIEAKILDVVQMNSVTADARPKCLVIDEIDGALSDGKGAVEVILKMLKSDNRKGKTETRENSGKNFSKKAHKAASLLRPVICICNDLYTPALRPLRLVAKVHVFVQPTVTRVVNRLKYICNEEGMKVSSLALSVLAEYTECDIRSCLNTLQFLNKKKEALNVLDIGAQVVGQKDVSRSAFDIWKEIFQKRKMKPNKKSDNKRNMSGISDSIFSLVSNRGDYDIISDGIHENLLQLKYHDPVMQKTVKCFNALGTSDLMHQHTMRSQQMALLAYQPLLATKIHHLVSQVQKPHIEWPKSYQRCRTTQMERMEILRSWQNQMPPCISRHLSCKASVKDLITPLLHVLSPSTLRPVALHLLSEKDKNDLAHLVSIMISYCITYKNIKTDHLSPYEQEAALETSFTLAFDPPFHEFIGFKGHSSSHYVLPLAIKQFLVLEVEKQRILRVSKSTDLTRGANKENENIQLGKNCKPCSSAALSKTDSTRTATPNVDLTGNTRKPFRTSASFFDRFSKASVKVGDASEDAVEKTSLLQGRESRPVLFKFNEGFTNAIKRPVRMRDFLS